jgi:hypothetical protein
MSLKRASLLAPKRAVFVAGVSLAAARRLRAGDAGESPHGSGDWWCLSRYWCSEERLVQWPWKGAFWCSWVLHVVRVGGESDGSTRSERGQWRQPTMRSVAACGVLQVHVTYTGRADGLRCVELLPTQVGAAAVMNSRRERSCWWYCRSERSAGRTGTDGLMWRYLVESGVVDVDWLKLLRVRVTLRLTVSQSVCLGVEPHLGLMTRYLFWMKVTVLSMWGALSDKRSGLSFVSQSRQ